MRVHTPSSCCQRSCLIGLDGLALQRGNGRQTGGHKAVLLVKGEQGRGLFESVCSKMSFLGVDEDRIVEQLKPELQKLVDSVMSLASTLVLAIIICTIVYIYRQMKEEKRAKELHSRRMVN